MAVRILTYLGLIYEDLIKQKKQGLTQEGLLPPVLAMVFYSGRLKWRAATHLRDCMSSAIPPSWLRFQPQLEYTLIDLNQVKDSPEGTNNAVDLMIRLEKAKSPQDILKIYQRMMMILKSSQFDRLRRNILIYVVRSLKIQERFPNIELDKLDKEGNMLGENLTRWVDSMKEVWHQEGRQEGAQEGQRQANLEILLKLMAKRGQVSCQQKNKLANLSTQELQDALDNYLHLNEKI